MKKLGVIALVLFIVISYVALSAGEKRVKELSFDESRWDPILITRLDSGPRYLPRDLVINIPPPHSSFSPETTKEIAYLQMLEEQRTREQEELINSQIDEFKPYFLEQAGIDPTTKPLTLLLMKEVANEVGFFILREKWHFQRARPYDVNPTLDISIAPPPHSSYPSGHGGQSWAMALLLSEFEKKHKDLWFETARSIGHNREIAGVHFPSDTLAGQSVANQVVPVLLGNPVFKTKFEQVKLLEWSDNL